MSVVPPSENPVSVGIDQNVVGVAIGDGHELASAARSHRSYQKHVPGHRKTGFVVFGC